MYATNYFEEKFLNTLRGVPFSAPTKVYIGLYLSNPSETGATGIEASYSGYQRVEVTFKSPVAMNGGVGITNAATVTFAQASVDSGTVTHIGISDALTGGNMLAYGELTEPLSIKANEAPTLLEDEIIFYLNGNLSTTYKTRLLNLFRGNTLAATTPAIGLFSGNPESLGNEFSAANYEREAISFTPPTENANQRMVIESSANVAFNIPSTDWGNMTHFAIMDALTGGNPIFIGAISPNKEIKKGHNVQILASNLKASIN